MIGRCEAVIPGSDICVICLLDGRIVSASIEVIHPDLVEGCVVIVDRSVEEPGGNGRAARIMAPVRNDAAIFCLNISYVLLKKIQPTF